MTVWFGVGLIVYAHLVILVVGLICAAETRKLKMRVKDLEMKSEEAARGPSNQVKVTEEGRRPGPDTAAVEPPAAAHPVAHSSPAGSKVAELAAQGLSGEEIARRTGTPRAEADFLVKLRRLQSRKARSAAS